MDKDEMKNRISMALKDPILQQGFEIICKENEELKKDYEETEELLDKQIEETYKLFEENAKLKEKLEIEQNARGDFGKAVTKDRQLAKAKELLKFWVNDFYDNSFNPIKYEKRYNVLVETEQFLKL